MARLENVLPFVGIMVDLIAFPDLSPAQQDGLAALLAGHPVFDLYLRAALAAQDRDRAAYLSENGKGAVLAIQFERQTIRTLIGPLPEAIIQTVAPLPTAGELHIEEQHLETVGRTLARRPYRQRGLRYYGRQAAPEPTDPRCRRLGPADADPVRAFFAAHYPATIFSSWMLGDLFVGLFEGDDLLACGGVVARAGTAVNIGNFLTRPDQRGRSLGKALVRHLLGQLAADGIHAVTLGTNDDNPAACRLYEACGFQLIEARLQLDLAASRG